MAERGTVLALDLPGHEFFREKPVDGDYSLGAFASISRDLMVMLGHDRATIVGQSLGLGVAMQLAYQFPSRCRRLVLVGSRSGGLRRRVAPILRACVSGRQVPVPRPVRVVVPRCGPGVCSEGCARSVCPWRVCRADLAGRESLTEPETRRVRAHAALRRPSERSTWRARPVAARREHPDAVDRVGRPRRDHPGPPPRPARATRAQQPGRDLRRRVGHPHTARIPTASCACSPTSSTRPGHASLVRRSRRSA